MLPDPTSPTSPAAGLRWPLALGAAAAGVFVYLNSLRNPFVYDDHRLIIENESLAALPDFYAVLVHEVTRPLVNLTYAVDWSIWGLDPLGFHVTNILLHAVNVVLAFVLASRLTSDEAGRYPAGSIARPAFVASATALVFAVNPMMTQAVGYVSGRSELLCATFLLLALLALRQYARTGGLGWWLATFAAWVLALASKEVAAMLPFIAVAGEFLLRPSTAQPLRVRAMRVYAPMCAVAIVAAATRVWVLRTIEYPAHAFEPTYVLVQLEALRRYAWLLMGQGPQSVFHQISPFDGLLTLRAFLALATIPAAVATLWVLVRFERLAAFGVTWFILCLVPSSTLFVLGRGEAMAEHRVYVAGIGFFLAVAALLHRATRLIVAQPVRTRRLAAVVAGVLLAQLGLHTVLRNATWSSPVLLWQDAAGRAPGHWLPHLMLGEAYREAGRCDQAVPEYRRAVAGNPDEPLGHSHLGSCLIATEQLDEAARVFAVLNERYPDSGEGLAGLGIVAVAEGRLDQAQALLRQSMRKNSRNAPVGELLAALERRQDPSHAAEFCRQVRGLVPFSSVALECQEEGERARP